MTDQLVYLVLPDWVCEDGVGEYWFIDILSYSLSDAVGFSWLAMLGEDIPHDGPEGEVIKEGLIDYVYKLGLDFADSPIAQADLTELTTRAVIETLNLNRELLIRLYEEEYLITSINRLDSKIKRAYLTIRTW